MTYSAITDLTSTNAGAHLLMTQGDVAGGRYTSLTTSDVNGFFSDPHKTNDAIAAAELSPNNVVRSLKPLVGPPSRHSKWRAAPMLK